MVARYGQAVVLGVAFLQLLTRGPAGRRGPAGAASRAALTGLGAVVYAAGNVLGLWQPETVWLIPVGALLNAVGFAVLAAAFAGRRAVRVGGVILPVLCLGMLLDATAGLARASPAAFSLAYLGPEDGVRLRMLRLARAAVTALSVTAFLYQGLAERRISGAAPRREAGVAGPADRSPCGSASSSCRRSFRPPRSGVWRSSTCYRSRRWAPSPASASASDWPPGTRGRWR